jgi:hypothetical protein
MKYFYFLLSLFFLLIFLLLLNKLPLYLNSGLLREYKDINELKSTLFIKALPIPNYLPKFIKWPPSHILGQTTPHIGIVLEFNSNADNKPILSIIISKSAHFKYPTLISIVNKAKSFTIEIKDYPSSISTGFCSDNSSCSEIIVKTNTYYITLRAKLKLTTLLRITESINFTD